MLFYIFSVVVLMLDTNNYYKKIKQSAGLIKPMEQVSAKRTAIIDNIVVILTFYLLLFVSNSIYLFQQPSLLLFYCHFAIIQFNSIISFA